jgi:hypothetical protein
VLGFYRSYHLPLAEAQLVVLIAGIENDDGEDESASWARR